MSFLTSVGSLPHPYAFSYNHSAFAISLCSPQIISKKRVVCDGSAQCSPRKRCGNCVSFCSILIGMAEVLLVMMVSLVTTDSIFAYTVFLISMSSMVHSITRLHCFKAL